FVHAARYSGPGGGSTGCGDRRPYRDSSVWRLREDGKPAGLPQSSESGRSLDRRWKGFSYSVPWAGGRRNARCLHPAFSPTRLDHMKWLFSNAQSSFEEHRGNWDVLNKGMSNHILLDSRFVAPLLTHFGGKDVVLAIGENSPDA